MVTLEDYKRVSKENKDLKVTIKMVKKQLKSVYDLVKNDYSTRKGGQQSLPLR